MKQEEKDLLKKFLQERQSAITDLNDKTLITISSASVAFVES